MVLTIDIGNTNIVLGGYENGALGFCTRISTDKSLEADQYALELSGILNLYKVAGENIEGAIISSVVPQITDTVARALRMFAGVEPLKLTQELPTGVGVNIDTPSELGLTCWPEPSPQSAVSAAGYRHRHGHGHKDHGRGRAGHGAGREHHAGCFHQPGRW